jgi:large subunit ribosomal protein L10
MSRANKATLVDGLTTRLESAPFVALADYRGITVEEVNELRTKFRNAGIHYEVIKNKLAKRAIAGSDKEALNELLVGMTSWIISGEDPIAAAKVLKAETEKLVKDERFTIKGGFFDGEFLDSKGVIDVAELPSKDELFAMLLGLL